MLRSPHQGKLFRTFPRVALAIPIKDFVSLWAVTGQLVEHPGLWAVTGTSMSVGRDRSNSEDQTNMHEPTDYGEEDDSTLVTVAEVLQEIQRAIHSPVISSSSSASVSPMALQVIILSPVQSVPHDQRFFSVGKKDGGLRPCIDYRTLNASTVKYRYPLPLFPAALEQLRGARIFSKLDLCSAYNLVRIRKRDEWKTAFITPAGHYEYRVMPYGLSNAPAIFQGFMNEIFRDFLKWFVIVYIDDILIYSASLSEHHHHVKQVLQWLRGHQLFLKLEKSTYAFGKLKVSFSSAPTLVHPNPDLPFLVEVDASTTGVGAVLSQRQGKPPRLHPCAFFLKKLSPAEQNYDIGNRELLAIKLALEEWRHWLEGAKLPFEVITDHRNLEYLRDAKRLNTRQARWSLFFTRFNFKVTYRPGEKNTKADSLSRLYQPESISTNPEPILPPAMIVSPVEFG
ncbi:unnamed protein product [Leuciscus chuanchicus]